LILPLVASALIMSASKPVHLEGSIPESQGMSAPLLDALRDSLVSRKTNSLVVIRHDRIIYEWYAPGQSPTDLNDTGSMAQVVVGCLSLAVVLSDGRLSLDDRVSKYVGQWQNVSDKGQITIRQLANGSSNIEDADQTSLTRDQLPGWGRVLEATLLQMIRLLSPETRRPSFLLPEHSRPKARQRWLYTCHLCQPQRPTQN
jgi:CubicO group peptidase (beta-lactamase class C family)